MELKGKIIIALDNGKKFILAPSSRLYKYCLNYLSAIPIPVDSDSYIYLNSLFPLPIELVEHSSIKESTECIVHLLRDLSFEIEELDNIWWSTSEWKYKIAYLEREGRYVSLLNGLGFLGRIDLLEVEESELKKESGEDNSLFQYLFEIVREEKERWKKILNAKSRHELQRL